MNKQIAYFRFRAISSLQYRNVYGTSLESSTKSLELFCESAGSALSWWNFTTMQVILSALPRVKAVSVNFRDATSGSSSIRASATASWSQVAWMNQQIVNARRTQETYFLVYGSGCPWITTFNQSICTQQGMVCSIPRTYVPLPNALPAVWSCLKISVFRDGRRIMWLIMHWDGVTGNFRDGGPVPWSE